jgi:2-C-methyl-D-erythritol 4-phosphate cytidylyltransferase
MTVAAILVAAGSGLRLGAARPKAFVEVSGEPLIAHAARALHDSAAVDQLVIVVPEGCQLEAELAVRRASVLGDGARMSLAVAVGGASRQASVAQGLALLDAEIDIVLVHDAARALASAGLVRSVVDAVRAGHDAVVPGLAVPDTIKAVAPPDQFGVALVQATLDRSALRLIQTPQGFRRDLLERAHAAGAGRAASETSAAGDDAALVEALGLPVHVVPGDVLAFKITGPHDLLIASAFLDHS